MSLQVKGRAETQEEARSQRMHAPAESNDLRPAWYGSRAVPAVAAHVWSHRAVAGISQGLHLRSPRNPKLRKAVTQEHQRTVSLDGDFHPQPVYIQVLKGWFGHGELLPGPKGTNSLNFGFRSLPPKRRACEGGRENTVGEGLYRGGNRLA